MSFGYQRQPTIMVNDTNNITALIYLENEVNDPSEIEQPVPMAQISSATFIIQRPQDPAGTFIMSDGSVLEDGTATTIIGASEHDTAGQYLGICQFVYGPSDTHDDYTTSVPITYNVNDPFETSGSSAIDPSVDDAWNRLSDLFDSEEGGPWLRDMTMGRFDKTRVREFGPDVFFDINGQMPQTSYTIDNFSYGTWDGQILVTQGLLVHSIRHLMRSYTEQPDIMQSPVGYADRKRYLDAWNSVYGIELERYNRMLELYKRRLFDQGTRTLVSTKSGRAIYGPSRLRGVFRGYY